MLKKEKYGIYEKNLNNVFIDLKNGREAGYYNVDFMYTFRDELNEIQLVINWTTENYSDSIIIPYGNVNKISLTRGKENFEVEE